LIHKHATQPIGVEDIVGGLRISRRALELRFRKAVGRGPHAELQRARLLRAQELLVQTDLPIPQVAAAAGYSSGSYLAQVFQRRVAMSPAQYRRTHRGQNSAAWG
jgi:LacI family transcriptional regulator